MRQCEMLCPIIGKCRSGSSFERESVSTKPLAVISHSLLATPKRVPHPQRALWRLGWGFGHSFRGDAYDCGVLTPTPLSLALPRTQMFRLVNTDSSAPRKREAGKFPPPLFAHFRNLHILRLEILQSRRNVIAHQGQLVPVLILRRWVLRSVALFRTDPHFVKSRFRSRHRKNQPAPASIHERELQHIAKKRPVRFRILGVDNHVRSVDHCVISSSQTATAMFSPLRNLRNAARQLRATVTKTSPAVYNPPHARAGHNDRRRHCSCRDRCGGQLPIHGPH